MSKERCCPEWERSQEIGTDKSLCCRFQFVRLRFVGSILTCEAPETFVVDCMFGDDRGDGSWEELKRRGAELANALESEGKR